MGNKEITSDFMLEEIISKAIQIPGVKVDRNKFLAEEFSSKVDILENIINNGPIETGISREEINNLANKLIIKRTSQSSIASFAAGIPGGLVMAATIPADILQFFGMALRLAQELSYLYGADDLWKNGQVDDEKIKNQLILYCGVMFGVSGAVSGVRVLSTQIAKTALKKIPQKALTKTFWYPIIKKTCSFVGYTLTKKAFASGVSKAIPVIGGVISGTINFASMMPMAKRLNGTLDEATFDYSEEEFNKDIEILSTESGEVTEEEKQDFKEKFAEGFNKTKDSVSNWFSKLGKNKNESKKDPIEEIKKYKELLDSGIINQEEFDNKKKELLNL
ncbi:MAG: SHOCT domain-containing protein [Clostridia bacterium]|nr:SHOCT domain-containing protein [Clostridia bacterium]